MAAKKRRCQAETLAGTRCKRPSTGTRKHSGLDICSVHWSHAPPKKRATKKKATRKRAAKKKTTRSKKSVVQRYREAAMKLWGASAAEARHYIRPGNYAGWAPGSLAVILLEPHGGIKGDTYSIVENIGVHSDAGLDLAEEAGVGYVDYLNNAVAVVEPPEPRRTKKKATRKKATKKKATRKKAKYKLDVAIKRLSKQTVTEVQMEVIGDLLNGKTVTSEQKGVTLPTLKALAKKGYVTVRESRSQWTGAKHGVAVPTRALQYMIDLVANLEGRKKR